MTRGIVGQRTWEVWGLAASVLVTDPSRAAAAESLTREVLDAVDLACSRFRNDSELARLRPQLSAGATVSPLLATLMEAALLAAQWTGGTVDPTLGKDLISLGYDRDFAALDKALDKALDPAMASVLDRPAVPAMDQVTQPMGESVAQRGMAPSQRIPGWQRITLLGRVLKVPADVVLDLGATAKAVAADMAATRIAAELDCGVLVNLGGDIATAGPAPDDPYASEADPADAEGSVGYWQIHIQDTPDDPAQQVSLPAGHALATSSTSKRRWQQAGQARHHILDPRFGLPAQAVWRSASVAAPTALEANAFSTAAIVKGQAAPAWLRAGNISARLVDQRGRVITTAGWPAADFVGVATHG